MSDASNQSPINADLPLDGEFRRKGGSSRESEGKLRKYPNLGCSSPTVFDALAVNSPWSVHSNSTRSAKSSHDDVPPVFMVVDDPSIKSGLRLFSSREPIGPEVDVPIEGDSNVYLLGGSAGLITELAEDGSQGTSQKDSNLPDNVPKQHSIVTIFSVWNTMMGTSILAMPWTLQQAGFGFGIFLIVFVAFIACYMAYLALESTEDVRKIQGISSGVFIDIADACQYYFGKAGRIISLIFSLISLLGASIVYYVLLTNFLFYTGEFIYQVVTDQIPSSPAIPGNVENITNILCPHLSPGSDHKNSSATDDWYHKLWIADRTVPAWLFLIIFPLVSIKSPTCLGKFTTLATLSVMYLFFLVGYKGYGWGVHMKSPPLIEPVANYRNNFAALTGTCSMAFYIHNALQTITRAQRHPENNNRDIAIAFGFATATYMLMGIAFFVVFPVSKYCIQDNFLNNLVTDVPVFIGRLALLFQMSMVYPMIVYIMRAQLMYALFGDIYPNWYSVLIMHLIVVGCGVTFAIVYPSIGTIIRFIGALCGLIYIFTIPTVLTLINKWILGHQQLYSGTNLEEDLSILKEPLARSSLYNGDWIDSRTKRLWYLRCVMYSILIVLGLANFVMQFVLLAF